MNNKRFLQCPPAGLFKQLLAMLYDGFLIIALLFIATAILLPFTKGEAIRGPMYTFYLVMVVFIFYSGFWQKAGQTLGMKVWKIRIITDDGFNPSWSIGFLRLIFSVFSFACFGMGYFWRLFTPYTWHDRLSQTRIIDISKLPVDNLENSG